LLSKRIFSISFKLTQDPFPPGAFLYTNIFVCYGKTPSRALRWARGLDLPSSPFVLPFPPMFPGRRRIGLPPFIVLTPFLLPHPPPSSCPSPLSIPPPSPRVSTVTKKPVWREGGGDLPSFPSNSFPFLMLLPNWRELPRQRKLTFADGSPGTRLSPGAPPPKKPFFPTCLFVIHRKKNGGPPPQGPGLPVGFFFFPPKFPPPRVLDLGILSFRPR